MVVGADSDRRPAAVEFGEPKRVGGEVAPVAPARRIAEGRLIAAAGSERLEQAIIKVNDYEEQGDRLYCAAMRRLYCENAEAQDRITWTKLFDWMEACCDACEDVMESVELVVMKNS